MTVRSVIAGIALISGLGLTPALAQDITLRLAHVNKSNEPQGQGFTRLAELVKEYTNGRVELKVFDSGTLGNDRELFNQVLTGAIDMGKPSFPILADVVPEYSAILGGYFYDDYEDQKRLLEAEEFGQAWNQRLLDEAGLRVIGLVYQGVRDVTINGLQPHIPGDFNGVKLRAVPNPMALAVVSGLGASPTPVPFPELFQALSQNVVDGQENPLPTIYANKFYEVQDTLVLTEHQIASQPIVINEETWQKLSVEDQKSVTRAVSEAMDWASEEGLRQEAEIVDMLKAEGMTVVELSAEERAAFAEAVRASVLDAFDGKDWPVGFGQTIIDFAKN